jgi:hypothetical protein
VSLSTELAGLKSLALANLRVGDLDVSRNQLHVRRIPHAVGQPAIYRAEPSSERNCGYLLRGAHFVRQ